MVTHSHSGISFLDVQGKTHPSVGHVGIVEQQPLIYRTRDLFHGSTCFTSFVSQLLLKPYSQAGEEFCALKGGAKNITYFFRDTDLGRGRPNPVPSYSGILSPQSDRFW